MRDMVIEYTVRIDEATESEQIQALLVVNKELHERVLQLEELVDDLRDEIYPTQSLASNLKPMQKLVDYVRDNAGDLFDTCDILESLEARDNS